MPTLFLELNADRLLAGAKQAEAALKPVQAQATAVGKQLETSARGNAAYSASIGEVTQAARATPAAMAAATAATVSNTTATIAGTVAQKAMALASTIGQRAMSGFLRTIAVTPLVALATAASGLVLELGKMALGLSENTEAAKKHAAQMARSKEAADAFRQAVTQANESGLAAGRFGEIGDLDSQLAARVSQLNAIKEFYQQVSKARPEEAVKSSAFSSLGIPAPDPSLANYTQGTGFQSRFTTPAVSYNKQDTLAFLKSYIDGQERAIKADEEAATAAEKMGEARATALRDLAALYSKAESPAARQAGATDILGRSGVSGNALSMAADAYARIAQAIDSVTRASDKAGPSLEKLNAYYASAGESKAAANEQLLAAIEASEEAVKKAQMGEAAHSKATSVANIKALAIEGGATAARADQLGAAEAARIDTVSALAASEKAAAKASEQYAQAVEQSTAGFASGFGNAATDLLSGMSSLGGAFETFAASVANQVLQKNAIEPAGQAVGAGLTSYFSSLGVASAKGNVFAPHGLVTAFASGGVVSNPTLFGYGGGSVGIMGEQGSEAVMPLKRTSSGRLGVEVSGGGRGGSSTYNFTFNGTPEPSRVRFTAQQAARAMERASERR